jgi:Kef-type K+ transport system membrane component KefB
LALFSAYKLQCGFLTLPEPKWETDVSFIEALLLLLLVSRVIGEISEHFGQPAMIGEILAGIILGPSLLGYIQFTSEIKAIADLGVLLLVFLAGMEMDLDVLWKAFRGQGVWIGVAGFTFPMIFGLLIGAIFGMDATRALLLVYVSPLRPCR